MHKLGLVLASLLLMLVAGLLAFKAEATPMLPSIPQSSPVETVACGGPGPYCPPGRTRVCGPAGCYQAPTIVLGAGATDPNASRPPIGGLFHESRVPFGLPHHLLGDALGDDAI